MNKDDILKAQIDALIRDEIQEVINEYVDTQEESEKSGVNFVDKEGEEELKVNISKAEVDKIVKEYKKIKKRQRKSNLHQVKLLDSLGKPLR
tara:strand:- start:362 stop:637 length:276 start_codon:yes stop_codon:yes gene_type:complete